MKIGLYVPHDPHIIQPIQWKNLVLNAAQLGAVEMRKELEKHGRDMRKKVRTCSSGEQKVSWTRLATTRRLSDCRPDERQTRSDFKQTHGVLVWVWEISGPGT